MRRVILRVLTKHSTPHSSARYLFHAVVLVQFSSLDVVNHQESSIFRTGSDPFGFNGVTIMSERIDYSIQYLDPDVLVKVPYHCIARMMNWISYTDGARPGTAFARDISIVQESINNARKEIHNV